MSSYNKNSKSYKSYEMLTQLLSSDRKENIDRVYDALRQLTESDYQAKASQSGQDYAKARDTLAKNRAKSEKYLNYFINEGGYADSGTEADARLKQELNYKNNVSQLDMQEQNAIQELEREKAEQLLKIESERAEKHAQADSEIAEQEYKNELLQIEKDKQELDEKKYASAVNNSSSSSSSSSSGSGGGYSSGGGSNAYYAVMYNDAMRKLAECKTADDVQVIYDGLTGTNTEHSESLYGSFYTKLLADVRTSLLEKRESENYEKKVQELCQMFLRPGARAQEMFIRMYHEASMTSTSQYTPAQVEEAYRRVARIYS